MADTSRDGQASEQNNRKLNQGHIVHKADRDILSKTLSAGSEGWTIVLTQNRVKRAQEVYFRRLFSEMVILSENDEFCGLFSGLAPSTHFYFHKK